MTLSVCSMAISNSTHHTDTSDVYIPPRYSQTMCYYSYAMLQM